jgi:ribonucleoside-triphosphate reductase
MWGPIGREVYERTYSRVKSDGTRETWEDTVRRVVEGNCSLVDQKYLESNEKEKLYDMIYNFKILPAGRHLWASGVEGRSFLFNCHRAGFTDDVVDHFEFLFDELMKGGGVGANYSNRYINIYDAPDTTVYLGFRCDSSHRDYNEMLPYLNDVDGEVFRVPDTREGWVASLVKLLRAAWSGKYATSVVFDVSDVRPRGEPIKGFGGTACGPAPLCGMLVSVARILNDCANRHRKLSSLDFMSIDHEIARCVVAGNVRRSARMSIKSWKDDDIMDFINCKKDHMSHWTTNISVEIDNDFILAVNRRDPDAVELYHAVIDNMMHNGEPGFYNVSLASVGELFDVGATNPCGEIALNDFENCNLGHVNLGQFAHNFEGACEAFRLMTRFLIRATFGDITNALQRSVVDRNRRIGVGFFGFQTWLALQGIRYSESHTNAYVRKTLRDFKNVVYKEKRRYAFQLRIPEPIKATAIAPTGTIAKMPGETEGIHPIFGRYFIRRVRFAADDPNLYKYLDGSYEVEDCLYNPHTKVVSFYCKDPLLERVYDENIVEQVNEISLSDMLSVQAMVQECYADNAVSFTVNIDPSLWTVEDVGRIMVHYLPRLKGTTIMPLLSRPQSPYEVITRDEYVRNLYREDHIVDSAYDECSTGACPVK